MPDISQYQNVFRIAKGNGSKRGQTTAKRKATCSGSEPNSHVKDEDNISKAQARLQRLEEMVTMLVQSNQGMDTQDTKPTAQPKHGTKEPPSTGSTTTIATASSNQSSEEPRDEATNGLLDVRGTESKYLGPTHWTAILENVSACTNPSASIASDTKQIKEIKDFLASDGSDDDEEDKPGDASRQDVIVYDSRPLNLTDILEALPPRFLADRFMSVHFYAKHLHIRKIPLLRSRRNYFSHLQPICTRPSSCVKYAPLLITRTATRSNELSSTNRSGKTHPRCH
jgi:hypothetical protein